MTSSAVETVSFSFRIGTTPSSKSFSSVAERFEKRALSAKSSSVRRTCARREAHLLEALLVDGHQAALPDGRAGLLEGERAGLLLEAQALRAEADGARRDDQDVTALLPERRDGLDEAVQAPERDGAVVAHDDVRPGLHDDPPRLGDALPDPRFVHPPIVGRAAGRRRSAFRGGR